MSITMQKTLFTLWLFTTLLSFSNCKKDKPITPEFPEGRWGYATAKRNGEDWKATCKSFFDKENPDHWRIGLAVHLDNYYFLGGLEFTNVPAAIGNHTVTKSVLWEYEGVRAHYGLSDADVSLGDYHVLNGAEPNFFTVDSYDSVSREIKGRFELTMLVSRRPDPSAPDTVRFMQGTYHTRLDL